MSEPWIIVARWANSSPTYHGPFPSIAAANAWARQSPLVRDDEFSE